MSQIRGRTSIHRPLSHKQTLPTIDEQNALPSEAELKAKLEAKLRAQLEAQSHPSEKPTQEDAEGLINLLFSSTNSTSHTVEPRLDSKATSGSNFAVIHE